MYIPTYFQSPSNKILQWALFMKQHLRFGLVWAGWADLSLLISFTFYNYFEYRGLA